MHNKPPYLPSDKMSDLICDNYPMALVLCRFGIGLGFGERTIGDICRQHNVDTPTFLAVVNFLTNANSDVPATDIHKRLSPEALIAYLHNAHDFFLKFRLPQLRAKLTDAIQDDCPPDVAFIIARFFDEYAAEVQKHMKYEETTVFPYVQRLLAGENDHKYAIDIFRRRHNRIERKITDLKNLLIKYYPGKGSHLLNSVLFDLFATEQDLASHNCVEDLLFIPAIEAIEKRSNHERHA